MKYYTSDERMNKNWKTRKILLVILAKDIKHCSTAKYLNNLSDQIECLIKSNARSNAD